MELKDMLKDAPGGVLLFDGGMGSMLAARGLTKPGRVPDLLVLEEPQAVTDVHAAYVAAGADVVTTNTFNANAHRLAGQADVAELYAAAVACARAAGARYVAASIGPSGELLDPYGDLEEDDAQALFVEQAQAAVAAGADLIVVETMTDPAEARIAAEAAVAAAGAAGAGAGTIPVLATMSFERSGHTFFGTTPEQAAEALAACGVSGVGMNCSTGPEDMLPLAKRMRAATGLPLIVQPNAGMPQAGPDGTAVYAMEPAAFAKTMRDIRNAGANILGGCCGTTPEFIAALDALRRS